MNEAVIDWNVFVEQLRAAGVSEITLKFFGDGKIKEKHSRANEERGVDSIQSGALGNRKRNAEAQKRAKELEQFRSENKNFFTFEEVARASGCTVSYLSVLAKEYRVDFKKFGKKFLIDVEDFYIKRSDFETNVLMKDGHYKGGVKFIAESVRGLIENKREMV